MEKTRRKNEKKRLYASINALIMVFDLTDRIKDRSGLFAGYSEFYKQFMEVCTDPEIRKVAEFCYRFDTAPKIKNDEKVYDYNNVRINIMYTLGLLHHTIESRN